MKINEREVALRSATTNYATLKEYMDRRQIISLPFGETAVVTVSGANFVLIDSSMVVATKLAIGIGSTENAGLFATLLAGAVGTGSINTTSDSLGNVLNIIPIRDANSHDPLTEAGGREIYALTQAVSTASDGDAIGGSGTENAQLSFVFVAANGTLTLTTITDTVEFGQNNLYLERQLPTIMKRGGNPDADALAASPLTATQGEYDVTTAFEANEVITLSTGAGATAGVTTKTGDTIDIGASAAIFKDNHLLVLEKNGTVQRKGTDVIWDSSGTMHFALALDAEDYFETRLFAN